MGHQPTGNGGADKGKGKDLDIKQNQGEALQNDDHQAQDTASALSRIAQSAASLPSFLMSGAPEASPGGIEKGESSRVGQALARAGDSSVQVQATASTGETLRAGHTKAHVAQEEASFAAFLDSDDVPMLSEPAGLDEVWQSATSAAETSPASVSAAPAWEPSQSVKEQMANDGAEVVALLSGHIDPEPDMPAPEEPISQRDLESLRKALFDEDAGRSTAGVEWDNVLNFIPQYLQTNTTAGANIELYSHLGAENTDEAWQTWLDQWSRVLTDYQDEVWGDLNALVDDARAEIKRMEEVKPGEKPPEPKALLRLRAILGHLRGT
ncbi:hypothetical protein QBC40DRAFT_285451 [Triangularia verruculosa]|uniref:Uncharacterized protein n=1 Tax=Triangularia verruculosa TaxID=2587418 RepID=A0AAN6XDM0_9PEZI|nr:hypothetical protein QBC40DRAFT_285451 [Triangularia verruculosa]